MGRMLGVRNPLSHSQYRNEPCVCASGKKTKKCCGLERYLTQVEYDQTVEMIREHNSKLREAGIKESK